MNNQEKYLLLKESYEKMETALRQVYFDLFIKELDLNKSDVYDSTLTLLTTVREFIGTLDVEDENLDLDKTKLPSLDGVFGNDPVSNYVQAKISALQNGMDDPEAIRQLEEAAKAAEEHQKGPQPAPRETYDGFLEKLVTDIGVVKENDYSERFKAELKNVFEQMKSMRAAAKVRVDTYEGPKMLDLSVEGDVVKIGYEDVKWSHRVLPETVEAAEPAEDPAQDEAAEPEEGVCTGNPDTCYCGKETEMTFLEEVRAVSEVAEAITAEVLERIEAYLLAKSEVAGDDVELIRLYLKKLPSNSDYEVDSLSDGALFLAWKRIVYVKNQ